MLRIAGLKVVFYCLFGLAGFSACERAPLPFECVPLAEGELAVTEVRGPQAGADTWGQWLELANTTSRNLQLFGLRLEFSKWDGSGVKMVTVRNRELAVEPGGYVVLGRFPDDLSDPDDLPTYVDYGFEDDFSGDIYADAILKVDACGNLVDQLIWQNLSNSGTWSFDGALGPSAQANDDEGNWCVDGRPAEQTDGGPPQAGLPGTPGQANLVCP